MPLGIPKRLVDRKQPTVGVVGDQRLDLAAGNQSIQIGREGLIKGNDLAGFTARQLRRQLEAAELLSLRSRPGKIVFENSLPGKAEASRELFESEL